MGPPYKLPKGKRLIKPFSFIDQLMRVLGIETSCDDTAIALLEAKRELPSPELKLLKNIVSSQVKMHSEYGGVVPGLAKREHQKNLIPVLFEALELNSMKHETGNMKQAQKIKNIEKILERYDDLLEEFKEKVVPIEKPAVDLIAVTHGPGLEPALWVGVNFARALSALWDIPIIGVDHMEGHIAVNLLQCGNSKFKIQNSKLAREIEFPAISLAVSGGHTQLILIKNWMDYEILGETLDDAAGEAFDKVARLIGLGFPGGPEIEKIAKKGDPKAFDFPRPIMNRPDYNFSFSGLKTAVMYKVKEMTEKEIKSRQADIAASFQQAAIDTLVKKSIKAAKAHNIKTFMLAGGVAANTALREQMKEALKKELPEAQFMVPEIKLATDNGAMIAVAGYMRYKAGQKSNWHTLKADSSKLITEE
ncbi:MAG: tRNA (adenosine(37)-N6)-threonylcarbamoyltransferase complex transferase subunit TsaD [Candidatus Spechtbacterales bacterium]